MEIGQDAEGNGKYRIDLDIGYHELTFNRFV